MNSKRASVLVVIVQIVVGICLVIPAIRYLRDRANSQATMHRMKEMVVAVHTCTDLRGRMPPAYDAFADITYPVSLHIHLLRFMKEDALYRSFAQSGTGSTDGNAAGFHSPSDASLGTGAGVQNYAANLRVFSDAGFLLGGTGSVRGEFASGRYGTVPLAETMPGGGKLTRIFLDGASNTICFATKFAVCGEGGSQFSANPVSPFAAFFAENAADNLAHASDPAATFQLAPRAFECKFWPLMGQSFTPRGITVAMGDGSVRNISPIVSTTTWNQALQPNDGYCPLSIDW